MNIRTISKTTKIFLITIIVLIIIVIALSISGGKKQAEKQPCYKKTITIWSPFEAKKIRTQEIIKSLRTYCVTINVQKKTIEQIKNEALSAVASGNGPSIIYTDYDFLEKNKDIFDNKIMSGLINQKDYPISVENIFEKGFAVYPITFDTFVLFWNRDLLNSIGYAQPPESFDGMIEIIPKLRKLDTGSQILLSPIALGASQNINTYFEIFLTMMKMLNPDAKKTNSDISKSLFNALDFYTQFTDSKSEYFSWHPNLPNQRDAFLSEQTAMIIDFYSFKNEIKKRNPRFNFEISSFPKFDSNPKKTNFIEPYFFAATKENAKISRLFLEMIEKNYDDFVKELGITPIKISSGKAAKGEEKILFNEMIVGDNFINVNKDYIKPLIKEDINNWISNEADVRKIIYAKQSLKFYKKDN